MMRSFTLYVWAFSALIFTAACDRVSSNKTRITLQMPTEMEKRIADSKVSSLTTITLKHLALQVTAPDLTKTYTKILDGEKIGGALTSISLDEDLPPGDNRLIQLVAAYDSDNSDTPDIFYGDVTLSLKKSVENIALPVSRLGAGTQKMTDVQGRFLTSANSGPTGVLNMIYRPAGKPPMIVARKPIIAGWFELSVFESLPLDYKTDSGIVIGEQWTNSSIATSNAVIRVSTPSAFAQYMNGAGESVYEPKEARENVYGFFASESSFLSGKRVCVSSELNNGGTIHTTRALLSQNYFSALPFKHFAHGTSPLLSANQVTITGGVTRATCGTPLPENEFVNYLWFLAGSYHTSSEDYAALLGLRDGFAQRFNLDDYRYLFNRWESYLEYSPTYNERIARLSVLPGLQNVVDQVQIFETTNGGYYNYTDDRCDRMNPSLWAVKKVIPAFFVGHDLILRDKDFTTNVSSAVCLMKDGKPLGRFKSIYFSNQSPTPATSMNWGYRKMPDIQECFPVSLNLHSSTGTPYLPLENGTFTVQSRVSGVPLAVLYPTGTCSGTASSDLDVVFNRGKISRTFYIKSGTAQSFDLAVTTSISGISLPSPTSMSIMTSSGTATDLQLQNDFYLDPGMSIGLTQMFPFQCLPVRVQALSSSGNFVALDGTITLSLKDFSGALATKPAGFDFYETCASTTPISTLSTSGDVFKSFVIKSGLTVPKDVKVKVSWSSLESFTTLNPIERAKKLMWTLGTPTPLTGACTSATLKALDHLNNPVSVTANVYVNFSASALAPEDIQIFSDSGCGTQINSGTIAQNTTQSTFYIRTSREGSNFYLRAMSDQVGQGADLNFASSAGTLVINGPTTAVANQSLDFVISGGTPPYNITAFDASVVPTPTVVWNGSTHRYHVQATVVSTPVTGTPITFTVTDNNGQVFSPSFTVSP